MGMLSRSLGVTCAVGALALAGCAGSNQRRAAEASHHAVPRARTVRIAAVKQPRQCPELVMCIPTVQPRGLCREPAMCMAAVPVPSSPCPELVYCAPACPQLDRAHVSPPREPNLDPGIIASPSGPGGSSAARSCASR
jgi:hypothetical protein